MIFSIYDEIAALSTASEEEVKAKLAQLNIAHIFAYPLTTYIDNGWVKPIVLYAAYTYSWESKLVKAGADWLKTKISNAQKAFLPEDAYEDVVHLKQGEMASCFMNFLHLYRDNMDYVHMTSLKEMYQQVMLNATKIRSDANGNTNLEDKFEDIKKGNKLRQEIRELEDELKKKYVIETRSANDFKFDASEQSNPLMIENSPLIKG